MYVYQLVRMVNGLNWLNRMRIRIRNTKSESVKVWEDVGFKLEKRRDSIIELCLLSLLLLLRGWFAWVRVLL